MVEIFFSIITRRAIRRGSFGSVKDLVAATWRFIDGWNERCTRSSGPRPQTSYSTTAGPVKEHRLRDTRNVLIPKTCSLNAFLFP
jgi:hypothetical protein